MLNKNLTDDLNHHYLKIGLIINPIAGIAGRVALKGSDDLEIQKEAFQRGAKPEAINRTKMALSPLVSELENIKFYTVEGTMGSDLLESMGIEYEIVHQPKELTDKDYKTSEKDTIAAALKMKSEVDILLFSGGDGTARNILEAVGDEQLCLGIPAGCKIYSAVFTVIPEDVGNLIVNLIHGELVDIQEAQVLDINEKSYREGRLDTKVYGEMRTPRNGGFVQGVKVSGVESEDLAHQEIAAWVIENTEVDILYIIGAGSSCKAIKDEMGIDGSVLGVDVIRDGECLLKDAQENQILSLMLEHEKLYGRDRIKLILTFIGGQGVVFGRGNHQVCHQVIEQLGLDNLIVVSSKSKIKALGGNALAVDTGKQSLNTKLSGYITIITGYDDTILYPIGRSLN